MSIESEQRKLYKALSKFAEIPYDHEKVFPKLSYDSIQEEQIAAARLMNDLIATLNDLYGIDDYTARKKLGIRFNADNTWTLFGANGRCMNVDNQFGFMAGYNREIEIRKLAARVRPLIENVQNDALDALVYASTYIFREDNNMKKDSIADIQYKNTVDTLQNEAWEKKKAIDSETEEKLAEAAREREIAEMKDRVDAWAEELYARYDALHRKGFAEDLAIELLKIYISKN